MVFKPFYGGDIRRRAYGAKKSIDNILAAAPPGHILWPNKTDKPFY